MLSSIARFIASFESNKKSRLIASIVIQQNICRNENLPNFKCLRGLYLFYLDHAKTVALLHVWIVGKEFQELIQASRHTLQFKQNSWVFLQHFFENVNLSILSGQAHTVLLFLSSSFCQEIATPFLVDLIQKWSQKCPCVPSVH